MKVNYRKIYEDNIGNIPKGFEIHHVDGNRNNNDVSNLVCVSIEEHYKIHQSQGDWGACRKILKRMNMSEEEKNKLSSECSKNFWSNLSLEERRMIGQKISKSQLGKPKTGKVAKGHTKSDEWRQKISESNKRTKAANPEKTTKGKSWWNNGSINTRSKDSPGPEWVKGKLPHNKSYNSDKMKEIWALRKAGKLPMPDYGK